jgi:hypothetical protein
MHAIGSDRGVGDEQAVCKNIFCPAKESARRQPGCGIERAETARPPTPLADVDHRRLRRAALAQLLESLNLALRPNSSSAFRPIDLA